MKARAGVRRPAGLRCHAAAPAVGYAAAVEGPRRIARAAGPALNPAGKAPDRVASASGAAAAVASDAAAVAGSRHEAAAAACSVVAGQVAEPAAAAAAAVVVAADTALVPGQHQAGPLPAAAACRSCAAALRKPVGSWAACIRAAPDVRPPREPAAALGFVPAHAPVHNGDDCRKHDRSCVER